VNTNAYEAQARFLELLGRVARSERFTIIEQGRPVAQLLPVERTGPNRREAIERLKRFREGQTLDVPVRQLIGRGRC
jgi:antitoxin (DNA-binding transcriptional repressor) of toxin-antitoxin stability system